MTGTSSAPPLVLAIAAGPAREDIGPLQSGDWHLGRAPENDVVLVDLAVSRQHALVGWNGSRWYLRDLDSTHGTWLNEQRVAAGQELPVVAGDRIRIGPWTLLVRIGGTRAEPLPASLRRPATVGSVPQQRLRALFALAHTAQHAEDEVDLFAALCHDLGSSLVYDRVALLRGEVESVQVLAVHARMDVDDRPYSTTLLRSAEPEAPAVLESIAAGDLGDSLVASPVAHAVCIRLSGVSDPTWLYLDRAEPFRDQDGNVLAYVEAAARIAALAIAHRDGLRAAAERERLMAERAQARRVQQQLCASRAGQVGAFEFAFSTEPGDGMCGDFIDVVEARDGAVWCFVGDVVGHGTAAALLMATALAVLRSECRRAVSPARVADHLAAELAGVLAPGQFITLWLARIDATGAAEVVDAGHGQCWIARPDGQVVAATLSGHPPVGVVAGLQHTAEALEIPAGTRWIVATDGYSESLRDPDVRDACLVELARPARATGTLAALRRLAPRSDDDASLLVLVRQPRD